jgi:hypothetical protein
MMKRGGVVKKARGGEVPAKPIKSTLKMKAGSDTGVGRLYQAKVQKKDQNK